MASRRTPELDDCFALAHTFLAAVYSQQGKLEQALTALQQAQTQGRDSSRVLGWLAYVNAHLGRAKTAAQILEELEETAQSRYVCPLDLARAHLGIGNSDLTLMHLEKAADRRCGRLVSAIVDPSYDPVRSEPRFAALRSRMHLS